MNILYIGNYRDRQSGWADASECWVKALNRTKHNLAIRYFAYSDYKKEVAAKMFSELEQKTLAGIDIVIQNVLPSDMVKIDDCHNIGICYFESEGVLTNRQNDWAERLLDMDEVWVSTERELAELHSINHPACFIIPQSIDCTEIANIKDGILDENGRYKFYSVGTDSSPRKNLGLLMQGYLDAFSNRDNVELILKVSNIDLVNDMFARYQQQTGRQDLPHVITIANNLSREEMIRLHNSCDCYVSASSEESIGRPVMEAAATSNRIIVLENTSSHTALNIKDTVQSQKVVCDSSAKSPMGIYTEREQWRMSSPAAMSTALRSVYKDRNNTPQIHISKYDIKSVSSMISERLNEIKELCAVSA